MFLVTLNTFLEIFVFFNALSPGFSSGLYHYSKMTNSLLIFRDVYIKILKCMTKSANPSQRAPVSRA
jgi:hypothetical protein